jgi:hypothetical protein
VVVVVDAEEGGGRLAPGEPGGWVADGSSGTSWNAGPPLEGGAVVVVDVEVVVEPSGVDVVDPSGVVLDVVVLDVVVLDVVVLDVVVLDVVVLVVVVVDVVVDDGADVVVVGSSVTTCTTPVM